MLGQALVCRRRSSLRSALLARPIVLDGYPAFVFESWHGHKIILVKCSSSYSFIFVPPPGFEPGTTASKAGMISISPQGHVLHITIAHIGKKTKNTLHYEKRRLMVFHWRKGAKNTITYLTYHFVCLTHQRK